MHARVEPSAIAEPAGWRRQRGRPPLAEVFGSIATRPTGSLGKKLVAFLGPGYLVAVGYMDPGNWATSLAGGSKFGYALLTVALLSNLMAILLQALCARLGIAVGPRSRAGLPRCVSAHGVMAAVGARRDCDLRDRSCRGDRHGDRPQSLVRYPARDRRRLITALDVFLDRCGCRTGFRWVEAFIVTLLGVIAVVLCGPDCAWRTRDWGAVIRGFAPTTEIVTNPEMLYLAHRHHRRDRDAAQSLSAFRRRADPPLRRQRSRNGARRSSWQRIDSTIALMFALFDQRLDPDSRRGDVSQGRRKPMSPNSSRRMRSSRRCSASAIAPALFGIALLCCGMNSTVTATLAGQIVMEGFIDMRLPGWARRLVTRAIAIVPAASSRSGTARAAPRSCLILSQVVLALQLAVRDRAAGDVHRRPRQDGRTWSRRAG